MKPPARSIKVWIAAHVGSDGKIRPCPDNHASLRPMRMFACTCGGSKPIVLSGRVGTVRRHATRIGIDDIKKALAHRALVGMRL